MAPYKETKADDYTPADANDRPSLPALFPHPPEPDTELRRYRILSKSGSVRVSPLCLGAMSIGDQWKGFMGKTLNAQESFKFLDAFYDAGGNFIDTANNYQDEQSEFIIGEWMQKRGNRDDIVLATKYTTPYKQRKEGPYPGIAVNYAGNGRKSMRHSVEESLRKLQTDYIDILYLHWWDHSTSIPEVMQGLNDLVRSGKVLYLGISDTPAWVVSAANEYARAHGLAQFVVYQGLWNLSVRDIERDVLPMCRTYGMAIAPWGALGEGKFKTPQALKEGAKLRGGAQPTEVQLKAAEVLMKVAEQVGNGASLTGVAMAWIRQKYPYTYPIIGGTNLDHLKSNIRDLSIELTPAQMEELEQAMPFHPGFPTGHFGRDPHQLPGGKPEGLLTTAGHLKFVTEA